MGFLNHLMFDYLLTDFDSIKCIHNRYRIYALLVGKIGIAVGILR